MNKQQAVKWRRLQNITDYTDDITEVMAMPQLEDHSTEVHNSRRPLNYHNPNPNLTLVGEYHDGLPVLSLVILVSAVIVLSCRHTDTQTWINAIFMRLSSA